MYSVQRRLHRERTVSVTHLKHDVGNIGPYLAMLPTCRIHTSCKCLYFHFFLCKRFEISRFFVLQVCLHGACLVIYFAH